MGNRFESNVGRGKKNKQDTSQLETETQVESFQCLEENLSKLLQEMQGKEKMEKDSEVIQALLARIENYKKMFKQRLSAYVNNVVRKNGRNPHSVTLSEFKGSGGLMRVYRVGKFIPVTVSVKEIGGEKKGGAFVFLESGVTIHYENDEEKVMVRSKMDDAEKINEAEEKRLGIITNQDEPIRQIELLENDFSNGGFEAFCRSVGVLKQGETIDSMMNQINGAQDGLRTTISKQKEFQTNIPGVVLQICTEYGRNRNMKLQQIRLEIVKDGPDATAYKQLFVESIKEISQNSPSGEVDL